MDELLTVKQVAQLLQLHEITIRRYIKSGRLEAVRIGRNVRVPRRAVDALLQEQHTALREAPPVYRVGDESDDRLPPGAIEEAKERDAFLVWIKEITQSAKRGETIPNPDENDKLLQLAGIIKSDIPEVSDRHDEFIGLAIYEDGLKP